MKIAEGSRFRAPDGRTVRVEGPVQQPGRANTVLYMDLTTRAMHTLDREVFAQTMHPLLPTPSVGDQWVDAQTSELVRITSVEVDPRGGTMVQYEDVAGVLRPRRTTDTGLSLPSHAELSAFHARFNPVLVRMNWDEYFLELAYVASRMGTCSRRKVGAVAVRDKKVLVTGFNGAPRGCRHCAHHTYASPEADPDLRYVDALSKNGGRWSCARAIHAEANLIAFAARDGESLSGSTVYTNTYPCHNCTQQMVSAGVCEVVFDADYHNDPLVESLAREAGLTLRRYQP